jgi:hypothetical protein
MNSNDRIDDSENSKNQKKKRKNIVAKPSDRGKGAQ